MKPLTRRRAINLASSFLATAPLLGSASRARPASSTGAIVFDMANFLGAGGDADAAFAKALAAISKAAGDAAKAGRPVHIIFERHLPDQSPPRLQSAARLRAQWQRRAIDQHHAGIDADDLRLQPSHRSRSHHRL
jgi:hypothetical protein